MPKLRIHGLPESDPTRQKSVLDRGLIELEVKHNVRVSLARSGQVSTVLEDVAPDDVIEMEFDDGIRLWSRVDDYEADFGVQRSREGGAPDAIDVGSRLPLGGASRGVGEWVLRGLKVLGVDVAGDIVDFVSEKIESKLDPGPGLYRCSAKSATDLTDPGTLKGDQPILVLLHGTGSSCPGGFGGLWSTDGSRVRTLFELYGDRVLALQHRTLSVSPIENARDLLVALDRAVPSGAELHLVSHSRGGLVGELLARGSRVDAPPFDETDFKLFASTDHDRNRAALEELSELLNRNRFPVTRFVRIACPARGTTLASERLDRYLSIILNVLGRIPQLDNFVFDTFASLLAAVAKQRTKPRELPGIEAMMPDSPLVRMLNRPDVQTNSILRILGGDVEGTGFWGRLKAFATDLFYREDHDLVVNTPAMFGGGERVTTPKYWVDTGGRVNHFNYFVNPDTASKLLVALSDETAPGFHEIEVPQGAVTESDYRKRAPFAQPVVFILPGIMGSTLSSNDDRVWIDRIKLARGGMGSLRMDASDVRAMGLVEVSYGELVRHLAASHEVVPFPYDWREPLEKSAEALRKAIDTKLDALKGDQPVRLLAHSMGGLVVRTMLASGKGQETWKRMCAHPGARFIMLGTPNGGSHSIGAMLIGRDRLVKQLALLDLHHPYHELLAILAEFDGALSLLPHKSDGRLDLYDPDVWMQLHQHDARSERGIFGSKPADPSKSADVAWTVPSAARLAGARAAGDVVRLSLLDPSRMIYVAGVAAQTPCDILLDASAPAGRRVTVLATSRGDGRVPWETGIPGELAKRTYYMDAVHGDLANTEEAFPALVELLNRGITSKLSQTPPATRGGKSEKFPFKIEDVDAFPDDASLVAAALGGRRGRKPRRTSERVRVRVVHDNLLWAKSPVLVGHYIDDVFVGAEDFLDRQLDGRLRELHRQDLYPGACTTAAVVLDTPGTTTTVRRHPGAIVAGLGQAGELSPGALSATISQALTSYGAEKVAIERRQRQQGQSKSDASELQLGVTTLLVGTGAGGVRLADSIHSILRGVHRANARLAAAREQDKSGGAAAEERLIARITSVDICELFEDVAIRAVLELNSLARVAEFRADFVFDSVLVPGKGGEQRATFDEFPGWWQRVRIAEDRGNLKFESLTERARVEASLLPTQRTMVRGLLDRAIGTTATDLDLCGTLFEILVPRELKEHAPDRRRLVLLLDDSSAALPWELIYDRWDSSAKPVSVETGMIRQRITTEFRPRPVRTSLDTALVIGDPPIDGLAGFSRLPGAAIEAETVAAALRKKGFETTALIGDEARWEDVLSDLYAKPYRVLHIAAHGVYQYEHELGEKISGVVLGKGAFLTPSSFKQMRVVPDLVFINCCHLGHDRDYGRPIPVSFPHLAANVGEELIRMGVRAVITAGWAVDDQAADAFAQSFYEEMLHGEEFGVAVQRARQEIFSRFAAINTWGAYQCYGEPGYTLTRETGLRDDGLFVAERQFSFEVMRIANKLRGNRRANSEIAKQLERLVGRAEPEWRVSGITAAAIAEAYGELGLFKEATQSYERVLVADPATASLRSVEQLANLLSREASRQDKPDLKVMNRSTQLLRSLIDLGENVERLSLLGGTSKRLAEKTRGAERLAALESMKDAYERGHKLAKKQKAKNAWYPLTNLVAARVALSWQKKALAPANLGAAMTELREYAATVPETASDFWEFMLPADVQLLEAAVAANLSPERRASLESAYRIGARRAGTPREVASATGQINFLAEMARRSSNDEIKRFGKSLEKLADALTKE